VSGRPTHRRRAAVSPATAERYFFQ
jgi:hypothetical protein